MASSVVLILLLDNIPGNINRTIDNIKPFGQHLSNAHLCTSNNIVDPIIQVVNRKLDIKIIPNWRQNQEKINMYFVNKTSDILKETSIETLYNIQAVLDNSDVDSNSFESTKRFFENRVRGLGSIEDKSQCEDVRNKGEIGTEIMDKKPFKLNPYASVLDVIVNKINSDQKANVTEVNIKNNAKKGKKQNHFKDIEEVPKTVPFLVSIFESLLNVTAQTCGGTVLSSHWVLTAASCVNVLGNLYNVSHTEKSQYTIIANSSNPILEGTIHSVTQILQHPDPNSTIPSSFYGLISHLHNTFEDSKRDLSLKERATKMPRLVLMKVDPEIQVEPAEITEENIANDTDVLLYGWEMNNNDPGNSTMKTNYFPARIMSAFDCELKYGIVDRSAVCLDNNNTSKNITQFTQISSGSPVVILRGGKLVLYGVAYYDDHPPLLAQPVYAHLSWIRRTINVNVLI